jgi:colicin import membrane protein
LLRTMILALVLLLITLSAAQLGQDEQLIEVLRLARTPKPASSQPQPAPQPQPQPESPAPPPSQAESSPPRFVLNEPLPSLPPLDRESSSALDPSAQAQVSPAASSEAVAPRIPTEEEKLSAAEPYVRELFALRERSAADFKELSEQAMGEYLSAPPDERAGILPSLMDKYLPEVTVLESETDELAESILRRMTAALAAIGADDTIAQDARAAYEQEKAQQLERYLAMFSSIPS